MFKKFLSCSLILMGMSAAVVNAELVNITIWDGEGAQNEDGEVEDGCVNAQMWDLEGVFLDGGSLTMVGGYDFAGNTEFASGDLFIAVGDAPIFGVNGPGTDYENSFITNTFGYDYVIDFSDDFLTYKVISIDEKAVLEDVFYNINNNSNPWRYVSGGTEIRSGNVSSAKYDGTYLGFAGNTHNAVTVDLSFLDGEDITTHFTMACGNDNLMGQGSVSVPEPAVLPLLGIGLFMIGLSVRRKKS